MRILLAAMLALSGAFVAGTAQARWTANDQAQVCYDEARRQVLQGEALKEFMEQCTADRIAQRPEDSSRWQYCDKRTKLLSGEEKRRAMEDCAAR